MMIPDLATLVAEVKTGKIPLAKVFANSNNDVLLDQRDDSEELELAWKVAYDEIEKHRGTVNGQTSELQELAFKVVSKVTEQHEIASYVSDDFDLIGSVAILKSNDANFDSPLIEWLYKQYAMGMYPLPPLPDHLQD